MGGGEGRAPLVIAALLGARSRPPMRSAVVSRMVAAASVERAPLASMRKGKGRRFASLPAFRNAGGSFPAGGVAYPTAFAEKAGEEQGGSCCRDKCDCLAGCSERSAHKPSRHLRHARFSSFVQYGRCTLRVAWGTLTSSLRDRKPFFFVSRLSSPLGLLRL